MLRCQQFTRHCIAASVQMLTQWKRQIASFYYGNSFGLLDPPAPQKVTSTGGRDVESRTGGGSSCRSDCALFSWVPERLGRTACEGASVSA